MMTPRGVLRFEGAATVAGATLAAVAAAITVAGNDSPHALLEGLGRALLVATPVAAGLYAMRRPPFRRSGMLLTAVGAVGFLTTLAEASQPTLFSLGSIAGWVIEPLLVFVVLGFPSGMLHGRVDRVLVGAAVGIVAVLFLPTALLIERFAEPSAWTLCHGGCPDNAFMVSSSEPAVIDDVVRPLREMLVGLLFVAVTLRLAHRLRTSNGLLRSTLAPVMAVTALRAVGYGAILIQRREHALLSDAWSWAVALGVPLTAAALALGLMRWRLFIAASIQRLATRLAGHPEPDDLRGALADAFDDPELEVVHLDGHAGWRDAAGSAVRPPPPASGRHLTEIRDGDRVVAGILHDDTLTGEEAFADAATAYAVMTIDHHRLNCEAAALLAEVRESRSRIQASADDERRRIERDLHDGAQQRLVALRIKLELAADRLEGTEPGTATLVRRLGGEVEGALDEVRSLARGIYPSPLADRGLVEGLRSAAMQASLPTTVRADGVQARYSRAVESAAYFCCVEALLNAAKHAYGASRVWIELADDGVLHFEVRDDGAGFDWIGARSGVGLTRMHDRLAAVGGELAIVSSAGEGTRIVGRIPCEEPAMAARS